MDKILTTENQLLMCIHKTLTRLPVHLQNAVTPDKPQLLPN